MVALPPFRQAGAPGKGIHHMKAPPDHLRVAQCRRAAVTPHFGMTAPVPVFSQEPPPVTSSSTTAFAFTTSNTETNGVSYAYKLDGATNWEPDKRKHSFAVRSGERIARDSGPGDRRSRQRLRLAGELQLDYRRRRHADRDAILRHFGDADLSAEQRSCRGVEQRRHDGRVEDRMDEPRRRIADLSGATVMRNVGCV